MGWSRLQALKDKYPTATATTFSVLAPLVAGYAVTIWIIYVVTLYFPQLLIQGKQQQVSLDTLIGGYAAVQMMRKPINWRAENIMDEQNYPNVARCVVAIMYMRAFACVCA